jgi:transcriptional regulator with XRE-family HTH domain
VRMREHMDERGLTQETLGEALGKLVNEDGSAVTQGTIGHWLNKRREITLPNFFALCKAAGADPMMILFEKHIATAAAEYSKMVADRVLGPNQLPAPPLLSRAPRPAPDESTGKRHAKV